MPTAIEDRLRKIVMEQLDARGEDVRAGASFVHDLGADWLDIVGRVMALEDEFGLEIPDENARALTTVQEAVDYVHSHHGRTRS